MSILIKAAFIYFALLLIFRVAGRRTVSQLTNFDLILLLIISEATQAALVGEDPSLTASVLAILTLIMIDIGLSLLKRQFPRMEKWLDGVPMLVVAEGKPLMERMWKARIDAEDVLRSAREYEGLSDLEEVRFAVLETNGRISIIPWNGKGDTSKS